MLPIHKNEEQILLARIAEGDEEAFALLYLKYYKELYPYLWKFTNSQSDTEEVIQDSFMKVWLYRNKLGEIKNVRAWIFKVAAHESYRYLKKKILNRQQIAALPSLPELPDSLENPEIQSQTKQIRHFVQKAIDLLPEQRRKVFLLRREEGLKVKEIADRLGLSHNTVKNTLSAAQNDIRQYLESIGYTFPVLFIYTVY